MTTGRLSRGEFANRGFRWGLLSGAFVGFLTCLVRAVVFTTELGNASEEIVGPTGFIVLMAYLFSFPGGIALVVAGTSILAMLGGALGIVTSRVFCRMSR